MKRHKSAKTPSGFLNPSFFQHLFITYVRAKEVLGISLTVESALMETSSSFTNRCTFDPFSFGIFVFVLLRHICDIYFDRKIGGAAADTNTTADGGNNGPQEEGEIDEDDEGDPV